jgi:peptidoglycan/LPS O-acetylase OafA/YrhL
LLYFQVDLGFLHVPVLGGLSGIVILGAAHRRGSSLLEARFFTFMGDLSYAFYLFHWIAIVAVINLLQFLAVPGTPLRAIACALLTFTLATAASALSFRFFERPFLQAKRRFAKVLSGRDADPDER